MAVRQPVRRRLQNFLLIWLDTKLDESNEDFKQSLQKLRSIVTSIDRFTDPRGCFEFLRKINKEKAFMIVSGALGQQVVPKFEKLSQLYVIYVFCRQKELHEGWTKNFRKVKGVYTRIEQICEALQIDSKNCDRSIVSISFKGVDPLFIYTRLLKEAFLQIEDDNNKSIKELVEFCRLKDGVAEDQIEMLKRKYHHHTPIWWYTSPFFIHSILNRGLRLMNIDIILNMGFFIRHLHNHIVQLHKEQQPTSKKTQRPFTFYRGQGLSTENFDKMKKAKGGLMSFNNFLSTSWNRDVSLENFTRPASAREDLVGILFVMRIDPQICRDSSVPFADVKRVGYFNNQEEELLFTTHTIFRIEKITSMKGEHAKNL